jgi:hypothetical protein
MSNNLVYHLGPKLACSNMRISKQKKNCEIRWQSRYVPAVSADLTYLHGAYLFAYASQKSIFPVVLQTIGKTLAIGLVHRPFARLLLPVDCRLGRLPRCPDHQSGSTCADGRPAEHIAGHADPVAASTGDCLVAPFWFPRARMWMAYWIARAEI